MGGLVMKRLIALFAILLSLPLHAAVTASQVFNDSGVTGSTVKLALQNETASLSDCSALAGLTATTQNASEAILSADGALFRYDPSDSTSPANGPVIGGIQKCGTIVVDATGRRWKRNYSGGINIIWFGASTAASDNTTAIQYALAAAASNGVGGSVYIPAGSWNVATMQAITLTSVDSGIRIYGDGPLASIINYTVNTVSASNFLIYHNESIGGVTREIVFEGIQFHGVGATGNQGIEYINGSGGSGLFTFRNDYFTGFATGWSFQGSAAADTHSWYKSSFREILKFFILNNSNSVIHDFFACDYEAPASATGAIMFDFFAGGQVHWYGGYIAGQQNSLIIYTEASGTYGDAVNFLFSGMHAEMYGTSQFWVDAADSGEKQVTIDDNSAFTAVTTPSDNQFVVRTGGQLTVRDSYMQGALSLVSIATSYQLRVPSLVTDNVEWVNESITQTFTGEVNKPNVRELNRKAVYPNAILPDYESGSFVSGYDDPSRRVKVTPVATFASSTDATPQLPIPGAGSSTLTVTLGTYSSVRKFRLVVGTTNSTGGNAVWVVKDGGGSTVATFTVSNGAAANVYEVNVEQTQFNVTGNAKTYVLSCTTDSGNQVFYGYLVIEYI